MPEEIKNDFSGGMNLDDSPYKIRANEYAGALNISKNAGEGANDKVVTNVVGNRVVNYSYHAGGTPITIGAKENNLRNTVIEFSWHPTGYHSIVEFNATTRIRTKIFENLTDSAGIDVLGFLRNKKTTSINIYPREFEGDILFFLDSLGRPSTINIDKFKAGFYTPVTRDILDVAKNVPLLPPKDVAYINNPARRSNNVRKQFRFRTRNVYGDYQKTTFSPVSETPIQVNILDDTYTGVITNNNGIVMSLIVPNKEVEKIELVMSYAEKSNTWSDYVLVDTIKTLGFTEGDLISYNFYNDSTYAPVNPQEVIQLFDYTPDNANCQEILDGSILSYAGITEGYDKDLIPNVTLTVDTEPRVGSSVVSSLNGEFFMQYDGPTAQVYKITFTGNPVVGTVVTIRQFRASNNDHYIASQMVVAIGDTVNNVAQKLRINFDNSSGGFVEDAFNVLTVVTSNPPSSKLAFESLTIDLPPSVNGNTSYPTIPFSMYGRLAQVYFDKKGKTNGVLYNEQFVTPAYAENVSHEVLLPKINAKVYHEPPIWAHSFQWLMTKDATNYIYWNTVNVNTLENKYIYINVSNFKANQEKFPSTTSVLNYSFKEGDRVRVIKNAVTNVVFDDTYDIKIEGLVSNPLINGSVMPTIGDFIKIKKVAPISTIDFSSAQFIIQIYTPQQQKATDKNETFYEISRGYLIGDAGLPTRFHKGEVTDQNISQNIPAEFNFRKGEAYFRNRRIALSINGLADFNVIDRNIVDSYISAVNDIDGRPNLIDENARKSYFGAMLRFGQAYQANTNINGMNRFYANNFEDYDLGNGDIMRMKVRGRALKVFQKFNIGIVPLYNQISKSADGTALNVVTDKLLNPIQYRITNIGIGENAESLVSNSNADYFTSNIRGLICRDSSNGTEAISELYNATTFATEKIPLRIGDYKIYGAYDQKFNNLVLALEATNTDDAYTVIFNEETNRFDTFVSYHPEMMVTLGTLLIAYKDGQAWTHDGSVYNNFFGVQYPSYIIPVFNKNAEIKKCFNAIGLQSINNKKWRVSKIDTNTINPQTGFAQESSLLERDFELEETILTAAFLRDKNSLLNTQEALLEGDVLKGNYIVTKIEMVSANTIDLVSLVHPYVTYDISNRNF
jgi:hypothetical protein